MENGKINFADAEQIPLLSEAAVRDFGSALVVAPHPDDESLGCGGAVALLGKYGLEVSILVLSDGTLSHPNSVKFPKDALRDLREREMLEAAAILGVEDEKVYFFRYADRRVPTSGAPEFGQAVARVKSFLARAAPQTIFVPWRRDPHPDHQAAFQLVTAAKTDAHKIIEYPIWLYELAAGADAPLHTEVSAFRLAINSVVEIKQQAIRAHRSQISDLIDDDPDGFRLSEEVLRHFAQPCEIYFAANE